MEPLKEVEQIILHHTQGENYSIESLRDLHVNKNGWEEIGYHFVIGNGINTEDGKIYKTRDESFVGAHVLGQNRNSLGIALIGNFNKTCPGEKQLDSLLKLLKEKLKQYNLSPEDITSHKKYNKQKICPGKNLDIEKLKKILKYQLLLHKNF